MMVIKNYIADNNVRKKDFNYNNFPYFNTSFVTKKQILAVHYFFIKICELKKKFKNQQIFNQRLRLYLKRTFFVFSYFKKISRLSQQITVYENQIKNHYKKLLSIRQIGGGGGRTSTNFLSFLNYAKNFFFFGRRFDFAQRRKIAVKTFVQMFSLLFGIGIQKSSLLCSTVGISRSLRLFRINPIKLQAIFNIVKQTTVHDRLLRKFIVFCIEKKKKVNSHKGMRLFQNLPARGQRTKTNAQTAKTYPLLRNLGFTSANPKSVKLEKKGSTPKTKKGSTPKTKKGSTPKTKNKKK